MKRVFIAGATGYLGRHLCAEYQRRGWYVIALVRKEPQGTPIAADQLVEAQATDSRTLQGSMAGADLVVSCLGITRQTDGLRYWDVDYQANLNLLREAERAGIARFAYVHVLHAKDMARVPMVAAKSAFVAELERSQIAATVVAPTGYFSDMDDFLKMARSGRVWLFGDGSKRINPIHDADLASALADAAEAGIAWQDVGGPDILTHRELAEIAFASLGRSPKIIFLPDISRRVALRVLPFLAPRHVSGPARFFLSAMALDMVGLPTGKRRLEDHFKTDFAAKQAASIHQIPRKGKTS